MRFLIPLLMAAVMAWPQVAAKANEGYKTKEGRERVAKTLGDPHRDDNQKPHELIAEMKIKPGMTVADVGTGVGYMLPFLSKAVGPGGKVLGEDIQNDFLSKAKERLESEKLSNVDLILGTDTDPKLPANVADMVLVLDVYHHFDYPDKMLANIGHGLKAAGHLVIVDYYQKSRGKDHIRLERDDVVAEIERNGFRLLSKGDHLPDVQYILTFEKK